MITCRCKLHSDILVIPNRLIPLVSELDKARPDTGGISVCIRHPTDCISVYKTLRLSKELFIKGGNRIFSSFHPQYSACFRKTSSYPCSQKLRIFIYCSCLIAPLRGYMNRHFEEPRCSFQTLKGSHPLFIYFTAILNYFHDLTI